MSNILYFAEVKSKQQSCALILGSVSVLQRLIDDFQFEEKTSRTKDFNAFYAAVHKNVNGQLFQCTTDFFFFFTNILYIFH